MKLIFVGLTTAMLVGCGNEKVSWETQEQARKQAIENAEYNAKNWRNQNKPEGKIVMRGDSTISETCAQGDGWATVDVEQNTKTIELKCSTVSGTIGCIEKVDFQSRKQYSNQEGVCNKELPFPLPKILK